MNVFLGKKLFNIIPTEPNPNNTPDHMKAATTCNLRQQKQTENFQNKSTAGHLTTWQVDFIDLSLSLYLRCDAKVY